MTITKQLVISLIREISAEKKKKGIIPDYALYTEISAMIARALQSLVEDGSITMHPASVNRHPAYQISPDH